MIDREPATIEEAREKCCSQIPPLYQAVYRKAIAGKSLRAAVNAKCQDCCNWQRKEIENCLITTCPLHPYRPYQKAQNPSPRGTLAKNSGQLALSYG